MVLAMAMLLFASPHLPAEILVLLRDPFKGRAAFSANQFTKKDVRVRIAENDGFRNRVVVFGFLFPSVVFYLAGFPQFWANNRLMGFCDVILVEWLRVIGLLGQIIPMWFLLYDPFTFVMVSYKKLWKLLIDRDMSKKDLINVAEISTASVVKLAKGQNIQTNVLCKICKALKCDFKDIMEYVPE